MERKRLFRDIHLRLVLVESIEDLRLPSGRRRLKQPYWVCSVAEQGKQQTWSFDFVQKEMDVKTLVQLIAAGRVYTLPQYVSDK